MLEIERKFLVLSDAYKNEAFNKIHIKQGFLNTDPNRTVRVRTKGEIGQITVKGLSSTNGIMRFEWEKEIPFSEAERLLELCELNLIEKTRFEIKIGDHIFEVDEFLGENDGLVMAEVELESEEQNFVRPIWLGKEVTGDVRYYNSQLAKTPYKNWKI